MQIEQSTATQYTLEYNRLPENGQSPARNYEVDDEKVYVPLSHWAEATNYSAYLYNPTSCSAFWSVSPFEEMFGKCSNVSNLWTYGCLAYIYIPNKQGKVKQSDHLHKRIFLGIKRSLLRILFLKSKKWFNESAGCSMKSRTLWSKKKSMWK